MIILKFKIEFVPRDKIGYDLKKKQTSTPKMTVIDNLTISRRRSTQLTTETHWRVILNQKRTRESTKRKNERRLKTMKTNRPKCTNHLSPRPKIRNTENKPTSVFFNSYPILSRGTNSILNFKIINIKFSYFLLRI